MFYNASSFNQSIASWNVLNVNDMRYMFEKATTFINGPYLKELENWNLNSSSIIDYLLGYGIPFPYKRYDYIIDWDAWVNIHPTKISSEADLRSSEADEYTCSICITNLLKDETWRAISCPATIIEGIPHCFHKECIEGWFNINHGKDKTCPVCRRNAIAIK
jgi:hypothetical protein